jgi:hypothetical protein
MPTPPLSREVCEHAIAAVERALANGHRPPGAGGKGRAAIAAAAAECGICRETFQKHIVRARELYGLVPDWSVYGRQASAAGPSSGSPVDLTRLLRSGALTLDEIAARTGVSRGQALDAIDGLKAQNILVAQLGDRFRIMGEQAPAYTLGEMPECRSRPDNTFVFGATSDWHLGNKYERLDVVNDLYDRFERAGVDRVFHGGNWADGPGKANFNLYDQHVVGMDAQMRHVAEVMPRKAFHTYAISGACHEGWWAKEAGIDVGARMEETMRSAGREDWHNLGFLEAHVRLVNANTGQESILAIVHPGGGTAYALSYSVQKIVEALEGGEKPAVAFYAHFHKLWAGNIRNVWVVQTGCAQDQTPFMRTKAKTEAHVGGAIVELEQDPGTGAIVAMKPQLIRYFNQGYYNGRWSQAGPVVLPDRRAA